MPREGRKKLEKPSSGVTQLSVVFNQAASFSFQHAHSTINFPSMSRLSLVSLSEVYEQLERAAIVMYALPYSKEIFHLNHSTERDSI